jgi:hypothetical protein
MHHRHVVFVTKVEGERGVKATARMGMSSLQRVKILAIEREPNRVLRRLRQRQLLSYLINALR